MSGSGSHFLGWLLPRQVHGGLSGGLAPVTQGVACEHLWAGDVTPEHVVCFALLLLFASSLE